MISTLLLGMKKLRFPKIYNTICKLIITETESRYALLEGESRVVVYELEKCKHFILACEVLTITVDHKSLLGLFSSDPEKPTEFIDNPTTHRA